MIKKDKNNLKTILNKITFIFTCKDGNFLFFRIVFRIFIVIMHLLVFIIEQHWWVFLFMRLFRVKVCF